MTTQKTPVSLRIDSVTIEKIDSLAISEDRSRNYIINRLLQEKLKSLEKKHGKIIVKTKPLEKFRRKRRSTDLINQFFRSCFFWTRFQCPASEY